MGARSYSTRSGVCWHCGRGGHNRRNCSARRRGLEAQRSDNAVRASHQFAELAYAPTVSHALIVTCSRSGNPSGCYASCLADSGACQHMSPNRSDFLTLEPLPAPIKVYLGDEAWIPATAQGSIRLILQPGVRHIDIIALYVPSLSFSLVSIGQLSTEYEVRFTGKTCYISRYN